MVWLDLLVQRDVAGADGRAVDVEDMHGLLELVTLQQRRSVQNNVLLNPLRPALLRLLPTSLPVPALRQFLQVVPNTRCPSPSSSSSAAAAHDRYTLDGNAGRPFLRWSSAHVSSSAALRGAAAFSTLALCV